jgi:predicted alpha/beta hydrolase family esterase
MSADAHAKNALILHGTDATPQDNWFPWLKSHLEAEGYRVWVPQLPGADQPNAKHYTEFLLANPDWDFNDQSIIIGHSSGSIEILALLQALPETTRIKLAVLVGSFTHKLAEKPEWHKLKGLFEQPFDFSAIKSHAEKLIFVHSDNDPHCPLEQAKYLADQTDSQLVVIPGKQHFSAFLNPPITEVPEILKLIQSNT